MCGIIGIIGKNCIDETSKMLIGQDDRGKSSTGITWINEDDELEILKDIKQPKTFREDNKHLFDEDVNICIGHNRQPSIGDTTIENAHPFWNCDETFALVHNGTKSDVHLPREMLKESGHRIEGDTDSEVLCHIICAFKQNNGNDLRTAFKKFHNIVSSHNAILLLDKENKRILGMGNNSKIRLRLTKDKAYIMSDTSAYGELLNNEEKNKKEVFLVPEKESIFELKLRDDGGWKIKGDFKVKEYKSKTTTSYCGTYNKSYNRNYKKTNNKRKGRSAAGNLFKGMKKANSDDKSKWKKAESDKIDISSEDSYCPYIEFNTETQRKKCELTKRECHQRYNHKQCELYKRYKDSNEPICKICKHPVIPLYNPSNNPDEETLWCHNCGRKLEKNDILHPKGDNGDEQEEEDTSEDKRTIKTDSLGNLRCPECSYELRQIMIDRESKLRCSSKRCDFKIEEDKLGKSKCLECGEILNRWDTRCPICESYKIGKVIKENIKDIYLEGKLIIREDEKLRCINCGEQLDEGNGEEYTCPNCEEEYTRNEFFVIGEDDEEWENCLSIDRDNILTLEIDDTLRCPRCNNQMRFEDDEVECLECGFNWELEKVEFEGLKLDDDNKIIIKKDEKGQIICPFCNTELQDINEDGILLCYSCYAKIPINNCVIKEPIDEEGILKDEDGVPILLVNGDTLYGNSAEYYCPSCYEELEKRRMGNYSKTYFVCSNCEFKTRYNDVKSLKTSDGYFLRKIKKGDKKNMWIPFGPFDKIEDLIKGIEDIKSDEEVEEFQFWNRKMGVKG